MLNSFNTAAACYIVTTQLQHVFGIYTQNKEKRTFFKLIFVSAQTNIFFAINNK